MEINTINIAIDTNKCTVCASCMHVCPNGIYAVHDKKIAINPLRTHLCIACGQCMAVCKSKAVQQSKLDYDTDFEELSPDSASGTFDNLIKTRRSVRSFKNIPVPEELLLEILNTVSYAPISFPPHKTEICIVQNYELLAKASGEMMKFYEKMPKLLANPIIRQIIKHKLTNRQFMVLQNHVMPIVTTKINNKTGENEDFILRNAPVLLLFHANTKAELIETDLHIALTYAMLGAHAAGLGTCVIDLVAPPVNKSPELKQLFKIPTENEVFSALIVGYPKVHYFRTIKRNFAFNFIGNT
ncbi:MAG TPA: hypothetical protein DCQ31_06715 [Bacteroidales bacterium]|nr:hypothetical protein [Bacteroidales bacterium]